MKLSVVMMLMGMVGLTLSASDPRALSLVKLIADVLYKAPANNDFIYMVEHNMMDDGIANLIEGMSPRFASNGACAHFEASEPGQLSVGPVQKRGTKASSDSLQKEVLNILDTEEGKTIINQEINGKLSVPPPRFSSGGFDFSHGKRAVDDSIQKNVLNILDGPEGLRVMDDEVSGKVKIPPPKFNSAGFSGRLVRRKRASTSHHNIATGQHAGFANKQTALLARVRNICVNKASLRLFITALDDGTVRAAMYNVCQCNAIATTLRFFYNSGTY